MIQHGGGAIYEQIRTKGLFLCKNREFIIETQYESHEAHHAPPCYISLFRDLSDPIST